MENKLKLSIRDISFSHCVYSGNPIPLTSPSKYIEWDRTTINDDTIYTDWLLREATGKTVWILEPRAIIPQIYDGLEKNWKDYKSIWTFDEKILSTVPTARFCPSGGCWINDFDRGIHKKSKHLSTIISEKKRTEGHLLRHVLAKELESVMDAFGPNYKRWKGDWVHKIEGLQEYRFHLTIENSRQDFYFSEKLIDCLITGTIPIYWGCPSIGKFFNLDGMIIFDNLADLKEKLKLCTEDYYNSKKDAILDNYNRAQNYVSTEDWIYKNILTARS